MLSKNEVIQILKEGLRAYQGVLEGTVYHREFPVTGTLGTWGGVARGSCTVCVAGARYLLNNRITIMEKITELTKEGIPRHLAVTMVIGDPEIILDAMRFPHLGDRASSSLSGGMKVFGLFRDLGINVPPCASATKAYLTNTEVVDRLAGILLLNPIEEYSAKEQSVHR